MGAGRKAIDPAQKKVQMSVYLTKRTSDAIRKMTKEQGFNLSHWIEDKFNE